MSAGQLHRSSASRAGCSSHGSIRLLQPFRKFASTQQRTLTVDVSARKVQVTGVTVRSAQKAPVQQQQAVGTSSSNGIISTFNTLCSPFSGVVGTPIFSAMQVVVLVAMLGVIDAAYSGDWSRIGAISKDTEHLLQQFVVVAVALHGLCGVAAASVASQLGEGWVVPAVKGFLFGTLGVYEFTSKAE